MRLLVLGIALLLIMGAVSAQTYTYKISGPHAGTVTLDTSGTGVVSDGSRSAAFSWSGSAGYYTAKYWWISVPFTISNDGKILKSSMTPDYVGILVQ